MFAMTRKRFVSCLMNYRLIRIQFICRRTVKTKEMQKITEEYLMGFVPERFVWVWPGSLLKGFVNSMHRPYLIL